MFPLSHQHWAGSVYLTVSLVGENDSLPCCINGVHAGVRLGIDKVRSCKCHWHLERGSFSVYSSLYVYIILDAKILMYYAFIHVWEYMNVFFISYLHRLTQLSYLNYSFTLLSAQFLGKCEIFYCDWSL